MTCGASTTILDPWSVRLKLFQKRGCSVDELEVSSISGERLLLFLRAARTPGHCALHDRAAGVASGSLSADRIRELVRLEDGDEWARVLLDPAVELLSDFLADNRAHLGRAALNGSSVEAYILVCYPALLPLLRSIASGEITEEMLKESATAAP